MSRPGAFRLSGLIEAAGWLAVAGFLAGFLGRVWWVFDLAAHFRVQYAAGTSVCALFLLLLRDRRTALKFGIAAFVMFLTLGSFPRSAPAANPQNAHFKLVSFNVNTANTRYREVEDFLLREDADVVFLMEVDLAWLRGLRRLKDRYPYQITRGRSDNFGLAAYAKQPFSGEGIAEFDPADIPLLDVQIDILGKPARLLGLHTLPPVGAAASALRNEELLHYAEVASGSDIPVVMIGDFNLTPYSPWFPLVLKKSGLRSASGWIPSPTWSRSTPLIALPIDHALVSRQLAVVERKIGPSLGSDHNAQILVLAEAAPTP